MVTVCSPTKKYVFHQSIQTINIKNCFFIERRNFCSFNKTITNCTIGLIFINNFETSLFICTILCSINVNFGLEHFTYFTAPKTIARHLHLRLLSVMSLFSLFCFSRSTMLKLKYVARDDGGENIMYFFSESNLMRLQFYCMVFNIKKETVDESTTTI